jgi:hypothetical protein
MDYPWYLVPTMMSAIVVLAIACPRFAGSFVDDKLVHIGNRRATIARRLMTEFAMPILAYLTVVWSVSFIGKAMMFDATALVVTGTIVRSAKLFSVRSLISTRMIGFPEGIFSLFLSLIIDGSTIQSKQTDGKYSNAITKLRE